MSFLEQVSGYAKMLNPFLGAILSALVAYESRGRPLRLLAALALTVALLGIAIAGLIR